MKKTLLALSLSTAFGAAHAESSVTLYGNLNLALQKKGNAGITMKAQEYRYASHIGLSGKEDLGNGYAAVFKLEAEMEPDTGAGTDGKDKKQFAFNRQSYVGIVTPVGAFRFGRSTTPFTNMWVGGGFGDGRGIGEFTGGLAGSGLRNTQPEVAARWNNALFYDVKKGGFSAGLAVTTQGSQSNVPTRLENLVATKDIIITLPSGAKIKYVTAGTTVISPATSTVNNEGQKGTKPAYGAYARYEGRAGKWGYKLGAAYQADNGGSYTSLTNAPAEAKNGWIVGAGVSYGPVWLDAGYAQANIDNRHNGLLLSQSALRTGKSKTLFVGMGYNITSNDKIYTSYGRYKRTNHYIFSGNDMITGDGVVAGTQLSLGYEHRLSKRTVFYADVRKVFGVKNKCTASTTVPTSLPAAHFAATVSGTVGCGVSEQVVDSVLSKEAGYSYDIGLSHSF